MTSDKIEKIGNSVIHHGKINNRIYLMKMDEKDAPEIISRLDDIARKNGYTKIFAKVPDLFKNLFIENLYKEEAMVPGFYNGNKDCLFFGKYFSDKREKNTDGDKIKKIIETAQNNILECGDKNEQNTFEFRKAGPADIPCICRIYKKVFKSYPFPIYDPKYLLETMKSNVCYYVACEGQTIIAISSAEIDFDLKNAEMTDFATLPEYRKMGIATRLLGFMDESVAAQGIKTAYTIARALSPGMNITFTKNGYLFAGTLLNNTNIGGLIESMNVWYKKLCDKNYMPPHPEAPTSFFN